MSTSQRLFDQVPQTFSNHFENAIGQATHEKIESITSRAKEFASEKKEALYQKFDEAYAQLIEFTKKGHWTWQAVCFCTSLATLALGLLSFLSFINILTSPFSYILNAYITFFSFTLVVFECPTSFFLLESLRDWFDKWFKAFTRLVGRGIFYIFLGSIVLTGYGFIGYILGVVIIVVGLASIFIGIMLTRKLRALRSDLQTRFGNDFERIEEQFRRFDSDGDGFVDSVEFGSMCAALGLHLTPTEREYALNLLDHDRKGMIDIYAFSAWFNSRSKEFV